MRLRVAFAAALLVACARSAPDASRPVEDLRGAWRLVETASRLPGADWDRRSAPQGGIYVFSASHYSYFYVRGSEPRAPFADANQPTEAERAAAYDNFIAGAGTYTFDGSVLALTAEFRKNPNEMQERAVWRWRLAHAAGDTITFVFDDPPFLPGREWRTTLLRVE